VGLVWWLPLCRNPNIGGKFNLRGQLWGLFGGFLCAETLTLAENLTCTAYCGSVWWLSLCRNPNFVLQTKGLS